MRIRTTPELRTAAGRLLALEAAGRGAGKTPAAVRVCDRLRRILSPLLGVAGCQALLARAATLAKAEVPALRGLRFEPDSSLTGLVQDDDGEVGDGEVILVAHILGLLVQFVGEALMLRLVNDAWPKATLYDLDFDKDEP